MKHNQAFLWKLRYIIIIVIIIIIIFLLHVAHLHSGSSSSWSLVKLEFGNVGFWREKKTRVPRKKKLVS